MAGESEAPVEALRRFVYQVDELQARRVLQEQDLRSSFSLNAPAINAPVSVSHHEPDEEDLRSYLLDFRKFMAVNDPVFLGRVLNVAHRHVTSDEITAGLVSARSGWKNTLAAGSVRFVIDDEHLTPEMILDLWINGWYFHNDSDKRRKLDALAPMPMSRWLFIDAVVSATKVILYSGHVLKIALREGLVSDARVR